MAIFSLIGCLIVLIVPALFLTGLVLWLSNRGSRTGAEGAGCGRCGYSARGATGWNCPECGADLREVGIRTADPRQQGRRRLGFGLMIGGGALGVLLVLLVVGSALMWSSSRSMQAQKTTMPVQAQPASSPSSGPQVFQSVPAPSQPAEPTDPSAPAEPTAP